MSDNSTSFPLMSLTQFPSAPSPWSSKDPGELWVWGDFFFILQKEPITVIELLHQQGLSENSGSGLIYHYAMNAFYHIDKNPHGPSHRPILATGIEQMDYKKIALLLGKQTGLLNDDLDGESHEPMYLGLFTGEARQNLGEYEGEINPSAARDTFFKILGQHLGLTGQPKKIGVMNDAFGHPETGLPAKKKKFGCSLVILAGISIASLGVYSLLV